MGVYCDEYISSNSITNEKTRIAVAISARNEETVIESCIYSIKNQKPQNMDYDIFLIADNCSDNTVPICKNLGVFCITKSDGKQTGKIGAINELFSYIKDHDDYDGILLLDADDILDNNVFSELEKEISRKRSDIIQLRITPNKNKKKLTISEKVKTLHYAAITMRSQGAFARGLFWETDQHGIFYSSKIIMSEFLWYTSKFQFDFQWAIRLLLLDFKFSYINRAIVFTEVNKNIKTEIKQNFRWSVYKSQLRIFLLPLFKKWGLTKRKIILFASWEIIKLPNLALILLIFANFIIGLYLKLYFIVIISLILFFLLQVFISQIIIWNNLSFSLLYSYIILPFYSILRLFFEFYYIIKTKGNSMGFEKKR